jgi:hypothetical protein
VRCLSVQWWELPEVRSIVLEMFGAREGHHATAGDRIFAAASRGLVEVHRRLVEDS